MYVQLTSWLSEPLKFDVDIDEKWILKENSLSKIAHFFKELY